MTHDELNASIYRYDKLKESIFKLFNQLGFLKDNIDRQSPAFIERAATTYNEPFTTLAASIEDFIKTHKGKD